MVFSSITFLFTFLPLTFLLYFLVPRFLKNTVLFVMSLIFYAWGEPVYVVLMLFSTVWDYAMGRCIDTNLKQGRRGRARAFLVLSIVVNLGLLGFFKYADFVIQTVNQIPGVQLPLLNLPLPIGISFYTFQTMSYSIDLYRGEVPVQKNLISFGTYVTLFPQLIAGPIVRMKTIAGELNRREESCDLFSQGVRRFIIGLGKKVLLANNIGMIFSQVSQMDLHTVPVLTAWIGILAYTFQIYFDFSGYSDMAIGLGKMFGFHFPENFNYPYTSKSVTEFWRRWHISLSTWFKEYVYIPLGGNRRGMLKQIRNILVVWLLTGLWHGANWNFIAWGLLFGVLLLFEKLFLLRFLKKVPGILQRAYVMFFVILSWALFSANSMGEGWNYIRAMFGGFGQPFADAGSVYLLATNAVLFLILLVGSTEFPKRICEKISVKIASRPVLDVVLQNVLIYAVFISSIAFLVTSSYNPFLYFRF